MESSKFQELAVRMLADLTKPLGLFPEFLQYPRPIDHMLLNQLHILLRLPSRYRRPVLVNKGAHR